MDKFSETDSRFLAAHQIVADHVGRGVLNQDTERAAEEMARIAYGTGDRLQWSFVFARMHDYIGKDMVPPLAFLKAIDDAFLRFRSHGSPTLDEAFGLSKPRRGRPDSWRTREIARTNAGLVEHFHIDQGESMEVAVERVAEFRRKSEGQVKRDYLKYRRRIKSQ